jgi:hypothetical protein
MKIIEVRAMDCFVFESKKITEAIGDSKWFELSIISTDNNRLVVGIEHVSKDHKKICEKNRIKQDILECEKRIWEHEQRHKLLSQNANDQIRIAAGLKKQVAKLKKDLAKCSE